MNSLTMKTELLAGLRERSWLRRYRTEIVLGLSLILLTAFALGGACSNEFVNYDDPIYVTRNMDVLGGLSLDGIARAFTTARSNHWHPLTWISLQLDVDFFGQEPWGFHLTNLLLHTANVLLLFELLRQMTGAVWRSAAAAALFAVHPLHVESVAWVTERKDVLSTFFWLLTTAAYVHYARRPGGRRYAWVVLFLILGLLAKPMLITLPCTLLLLDYWPLKRFPPRAGSEKEEPEFAPALFRRLVEEKLLLFVLGLIWGAASLIARQQGGGLKSGEYLGLGERLGYAVSAYAGYLGKMVWPADLAPFYPLPPGGLSPWRVASSALVLIVLTMFFLRLRRRYLIVGWLWYLITLFPVSGVVQLGSYAMADRYTYVPSIGLFVLLVWGVADLVPRAAALRLLAPAAVLVILAAALVSRQQVRYWHDSIALWEHALAVTPDNFLARTDLAFARKDAGDLEGAESDFAAAVRLRPDLAIAHDHLGQIQLHRGKVPEAVSSFRQAVSLQPRVEQYRIHLAQTLRLQE
jgi:hypothetical protein